MPRANTENTNVFQPAHLIKVLDEEVPKIKDLQPDAQAVLIRKVMAQTDAMANRVEKLVTAANAEKALYERATKWLKDTVSFSVK